MNKNKDWKGNKNSVFKTLGSSHHVAEEREINDYYATDPKAIEMLLELESFNNHILEPACVEGHLCKFLIGYGFSVLSTDLIHRGFGTGDIDFLSKNITFFDGDIITNPPYSFATEFIYNARFKVIFLYWGYKSYFCTKYGF
jgi:hypothetical protein